MKRKKVLLVEDDLDHAELIIDILEIEGADNEIVLLQDGQKAIDYLQQTIIDSENGIYSQIDLVILDLNLPKVHGMDVLKFLRKDSKHHSTPVVILSTCFDQNIIDEAYGNGANGYITKPIAYDGFVEKIRSLKVYC